MHQTHIPLLLVLTGVLLVSAGCGGGGNAATVLPMAHLDGQVFEVDGETTALAGLSLTLLETDQTAVTDAEGQFFFGAVPTGSLSIALEDAPVSALVFVTSGSGPGPGGPDTDELDDGDDLDASGEAQVHRVRAEERIRVRLRVQDGEIVELQCSRDEESEREAEVVMTASAVTDDDDLAGILEVESCMRRERFEVEIANGTPTRLLEIVVLDESDVEESQGTVVVESDGTARFELDTEAGDGLPFDAASVTGLEGYGVEVRDADTTLLLLAATVPELPPFQAGDGVQHRERYRSRACLESAQDGVECHVELRSRSEEECLCVEASGLAPGQSVALEIESGEGTGQFFHLRTRTANEAGDCAFEINTRHGDDLPNDAQGVRDLVRLRTQLRDTDSGQVVCSGLSASLISDA